MKRSSMLSWLFILVICLQGAGVQGQVFEDAGQYISYIGKANEDLTAIYLSYLSAVAHNKSHRKVEKRRDEVVNAIFYTKSSILAMPPWKGDKSYRDTTVTYLKILNSVFNEDYSKIVNMEDIAEQSYDAMEAYMLAQQKADEKLEEARLKQVDMTNKFAAKYNVTLIHSESDIGTKSKIAGHVNKHYNEVYLVFFKPYKQEAYFIDALGKKNIVALEQDISSMKKFATDGIEKLKTFKGYNNDPVLIDACRQALLFYKSEAERSSAFSDFFLKQDAFDKIKKVIDSKRTSDRTQKDIDQYNAAATDMNAASKDFNTLNEQLNKERADMLGNWNKKVSHYFDDNMPVQKKQ